MRHIVRDNSTEGKSVTSHDVVKKGGTYWTSKFSVSFLQFPIKESSRKLASLDDSAIIMPSKQNVTFRAFFGNIFSIYRRISTIPPFPLLQYEVAKVFGLR